MLRQPKYQSILVLVPCLLSVVLALQLVPPSDLLRWHISVIEHNPANYRIEMISQMLVVSEYLEDDIPPYANINVYSPKGECMGKSETRWEISANDRLEEKRALGVFCWGISLGLVSLVMLVFAFINVLWRWWEKRYDIIFVSLGLCLIGVYVMHLLGPFASGPLFGPGIDFNCVYSIVVKAELISVNRAAITSFVTLFWLVVSIQLIAATILIRSLFTEVSKASHQDNIANA